MRWALFIAILSVPLEIEASCLKVNDCGCDQMPEWAAIVRWDPTDAGLADAGLSIDGGSLRGPQFATIAVLETYSTNGDAGLDVSVWDTYEPAGTRALLLPDGYRQPLEADGGLRCEVVTFAASSWPAALTSGSCHAAVQNAGIVQPPCRDTGCRCGVSLGSASPAFALVLLVSLRARRRAGARSSKPP